MMPGEEQSMQIKKDLTSGSLCNILPVGEKFCTGERFVLHEVYSSKIRRLHGGLIETGRGANRRF